MGITIVQKSDLSKRRPDARKALVLAGGAISGGAFKLGGLLALDRVFHTFRTTDFDIFMGISAGAFLAAPMAAGVSPSELCEALYGDGGRITMFRPADFYLPNYKEFAQRPLYMVQDALSYGPRMLGRFLRFVPARHRELRQRGQAFLKDPSVRTAEDLLEPLILDVVPEGRSRGYLPSGIFDNRRIESYIRTNLERNGIPNTFRQLKLEHGKSLYIGATNLDTGQGVVFGHDEDNSVTISQAVQASTAIPVFFRPARVGEPGRERDYCDAAIRKTANISTAVRHGASLVVCYNPFRPFTNYRHRLMTSNRRSMAEMGMYPIINQAFRTLLHSRLQLGIEKLRLDERFRGDVILIEPAETDSRFFAMNPLAFWKRQEAFQHGYESVKRSLEKHQDRLRKIFAAYGIDFDVARLDPSADVARTAAASEAPSADRDKPKLRVVRGGVVRGGQ